MSIDGPSNNEYRWSDVLGVRWRACGLMCLLPVAHNCLLKRNSMTPKSHGEQRSDNKYLTYIHIEDGFGIGILRSKVMRVSSAIKMQRLRSLRRCVACVDSFEKLIRFAGVSLSLSHAVIYANGRTLWKSSTSSANTFAFFVRHFFLRQTYF